MSAESQQNLSSPSNSIDDMFSAENITRMENIPALNLSFNAGMNRQPLTLRVTVAPQTEKDEIDDVISSSTPNGGFRIWAQCYIVTYPYWLDKLQVQEYFMKKFSCPIVRVAHEIGTKKIDYKHTHVFLDFGKQYHSGNSRVFDHEFMTGYWEPLIVPLQTCKVDVGGRWVHLGVSNRPHPNIGPITKRKHLNRIYQYMCKYDHSNDDMLNWCVPDEVVGDIWGAKTVADALKFAQRFSDVPGILAAFQHKPKPDLVEEKPEFLWQDELLRMLEGPGSKREIHWIYDHAGRMGKSDFCRLAESKFGKDVESMSQLGGARDCATNVANALERGWSGKILIVDFPRQAETKAIYEPLEMIKNGHITAVKYNGSSHRFNNRFIIVLANFYPDISTMTWDRWRIWDRSEDPNYFSIKIENNTSECNNTIPPVWDSGDKHKLAGLKAAQKQANLLNQLNDWPDEDLSGLVSQITHIRNLKKIGLSFPPMVPPDA